MYHWFTKNIKKMTYYDQQEQRWEMEYNTHILAFEIGDLVRVPGNIKGKVVNWQIDPDGTVQYEVEFLDKTLIPPSMWYPEHYLDQHPKDKKCNRLAPDECQCGLDSVYGKDHNLPARSHDPYCPKFKRGA